MYNEIEGRESNQFTFHFSGNNILGNIGIDMTDCIRSLLIYCGNLKELFYFVQHYFSLSIILIFFSIITNAFLPYMYICMCGTYIIY